MRAELDLGQARQPWQQKRSPNFIRDTNAELHCGRTRRA